MRSSSPTLTNRLYTGSDQKSNLEEIEPHFEAQGDQSETAELIPGSGIIVRRFRANRSNPWHHAPGRYAVFTLSGPLAKDRDATVFQVDSEDAARTLWGVGRPE